MRCSQECPVLFLLHFVFILAAGHEELSDSGRLFSLLAEQGQCGAFITEAAFLCMAGKVCMVHINIIMQCALKVKMQSEVGLSHWFVSLKSLHSSPMSRQAIVPSQRLLLRLLLLLFPRLPLLYYRLISVA